MQKHEGDNIFEGLEVRKEPHQIDHSISWKMYVDGAKNSLGAVVGIVPKSLKGVVF